MNTRIIPTFALGLLLLTGGCSDASSPLPAPAPKGEITIQTRADESGSYRLLAFKADDNACALNQVIKADGTSQTITLPDGNYKFVTLSGTDPFDLPQAGTTDGLSLSTPIPLKQGATLTPIGISPAANVTIPTTPIYAAELQTLTCEVTLEIEDGGMLSSGNPFSYSLNNMYDGLCPDGTMSGTALAGGYNLSVDKINYCLPTSGSATLTCKSATGETQELSLGQAFESGKSYTITLTYEEDFAITAKIENWNQNADNIHDADAIQP